MFSTPSCVQNTNNEHFPWDLLWRVWSKVEPTRLHIFWFMPLNGKKNLWNLAHRRVINRLVEIKFCCKCSGFGCIQKSNSVGQLIRKGQLLLAAAGYHAGTLHTSSSKCADTQRARQPLGALPEAEYLGVRENWHSCPLQGTWRVGSSIHLLLWGPGCWLRCCSRGQALGPAQVGFKGSFAHVEEPVIRPSFVSYLQGFDVPLSVYDCHRACY